MFQYIVYYNIPFTLIATKADKLSRSKRVQAANAAAKLLGAPPAAIPYSAENAQGRDEVLARMGAIRDDHVALRTTIQPQEILEEIQ